VARSYSPETIAKDKSKFIQRLKNISDGGIWTIEKGDVLGNLHINIIAGTESKITASSMAKIWPSDADFWATDIPHKDIRNVSAYIAKKSQMPDKTDYSGNLYGSYGTWKRPLATIAEGNNGVISALVLEEMMKDLGIPEPESPPEFIRPYAEGKPFTGKETRQDVKERLGRNEKALDKAIQEQAVIERNMEARNRLKRVYGVHRNEIELKGYVYVSGYGMLTVDRLRKLGFGSLPNSELNDH
jgi:hypothetical protein